MFLFAPPSRACSSVRPASLVRCCVLCFPYFGFCPATLDTMNAPVPAGEVIALVADFFEKRGGGVPTWLLLV